jgi:hypothetical protein
MARKQSRNAPRASRPPFVEAPVYSPAHESRDRAVNAEFNWWLLIVGVAAGAGLAWLTLSDWGRREEDLEVEERASEAAWIAEVLRERGEAVDPVEAEEVLALHRAYLQQAGLYDPGEAYPADRNGPASEEPTWGPNQWAHEAWDEEVSAAGSSPEPQAGAATAGPSVPPRVSIRSAGSVAPRAAPETRQVGSEPPQA